MGSLHNLQVCTDLCICHHSCIHRINQNITLPAHGTDTGITLKKIFSHNRRNLLACLGHSLFHNSIIRTHGNQCPSGKINIRISCNSCDLDEKCLQLSQRMEGFCNTVPALLGSLHCLLIKRCDRCKRFLQCTIFFHIFNSP